MEKDEKVSTECMVLMFMLASLSVSNFADIPPEQMLAIGAEFGLNADQMTRAAKEFSEVVTIFTAGRKEQLAKLRAAMN